MKALILAAGYAKRHYADIRNLPKPLLLIADKPIIELIVAKICELEEIDKVLVLTNNFYCELFKQWKNNSKFSNMIQIISNGTTSEQEERGAIVDLDFVIKDQEITDDLLVIAGDNFFEFKLQNFLNDFKKKNDTIIAFHDLNDKRKLSKRFGALEIDRENRITGFEEKPETAKTSLASTLCYILAKKDLSKLQEFTENNPNANYAGSFIEYLVNTGNDVYGYEFTERWFDIGNYEMYRELNQTELKKTFDTDTKFSQSIEAIIFFADIIGSATISEYTPEEEYDIFICEFQDIALHVIKENLKKYGYDDEDKLFCEFTVRGDETVFILYTKNRDRDIKTAISTAIELKRACFLSNFNRKRKGKSFYNIGIGIHLGNVILKKHPSIEGTTRKFNAEGYAINLAKRIEGYSREGKFSKIMLSKKITDIATLPMILSNRIDVPLVGIYGSYPIYELQVYGQIEDVEITPHIEPKDIDYYVAALESSGYDMWLLLTVARYFYDEEDYVIAQKYYNDAIERYPNFLAGYTYLGRSLYRQNKFREAKQYLTKAYEMAPLSPRVNNFLAIALRRLGDYRSAFQHHENATKFEPNSPYEYNSFAYTIAEANPDNKFDDNDLEKATKYLARANELFAANVEKFQYLLKHTQGLIELRSNSYDEAINCFNKAKENLKKEPIVMPKKREEKQLELLYHLGLAHFEKGNTYWKDALKYLKQSLDFVKIEGEARIDYYWFNDAKSKIETILSNEKFKSQ